MKIHTKYQNRFRQYAFIWTIFQEFIYTYAESKYYFRHNLRSLSQSNNIVIESSGFR